MAWDLESLVLECLLALEWQCPGQAPRKCSRQVRVIVHLAGAGGVSPMTPPRPVCPPCSKGPSPCLDLNFVLNCTLSSKSSAISEKPKSPPQKESCLQFGETLAALLGMVWPYLRSLRSCPLLSFWDTEVCMCFSGQCLSLGRYQELKEPNALKNIYS